MQWSKRVQRESNGRSAVLKEYSRVARGYDRRWAFYVDTTTRETLRRLALRPSDQMLDVGCGTGTLLEALGRNFSGVRLCGLDPSAEMLALARQKLGPAVPLARGWGEAMPFADDTFDVVVSCSVFHYLRGPLQALQEMRRVLRAGGRLVLTDWCDDYLACRACDLYLRWFDPAHFRVYRQLECHQLLVSAGFNSIHTERYKINWLWGLLTARAVK